MSATIHYSRRARALAFVVSALVLVGLVQRYLAWRGTAELVEASPLILVACAALLVPVLIRKPSSRNFMLVLLTLLLSSAKWEWVNDWLGPTSSMTLAGAVGLAAILSGFAILDVGREERAFGAARLAETREVPDNRVSA